MTEILLFHHGHGLTPGIRDFAVTLERDGHTVHLPDLYEGKVFDTLDQGLAYAREVGFGTLLEGDGFPPRGSPTRSSTPGFRSG